MNGRAQLTLKHSLTRLGEHFSNGHLVHLQAVVDYLKAGRWIREHGYSFANRVDSREAVWSAISKEIAQRQTLYLEFGVYRGDSIRFWSRELQHPESQLHGFDSFEGLPEQGGGWTKGQFDAGGEIPVIHDPRVRFFKGWFEQTLPAYTLPPHDVLVINMDADIYSSTQYVLKRLAAHIKPDAYIYFDEFCKTDHEARAFHEFLKETGYKFRPVSADKSLTFALFQRVG